LANATPATLRWVSKDLTRVMNRLKAIYRSWAIPCAGQQVYSPRHRAAWLEKLREAKWRSSNGPASRKRPFWHLEQAALPAQIATVNVTY
jgi:hypothetical protein